MTTAIVSDESKTLAGLQYRVVKALGAGAGSTIFLVSDTRLGYRYALKVVKRQSDEDDIYINQATHEYDVAQLLNHANLLKIHDVRVKKKWFKTESVELLMEFVDGRNLDEVQTREIDQLVLLFIQVAAALAHMHRRGIYHGDVKPGNIMLSRDGVVKLIDFGTAWIKGQPKDRVQGTPQYMAPEQYSDRTVDDRTDVFNFGATMYRMFTGHYANMDVHPGLNPALMQRSRRKSPISLRGDIPGTLNELILSCLEESPVRRPSNMYEIRQKLVAVARHLGLRPDDLRGAEDDSPQEL
jgi:serine/threonine-protein kinase